MYVKKPHRDCRNYELETTEAKVNEDRRARA